MIDPEQFRALESEFSLRLPDWYLALVARNSGKRETDAVSQSADHLRSLNHDCRENDAWGCEWTDHYWAFGGDGSGGIYFLNAGQPEALVYYIDHEDPPTSIDDTDTISIMTADDFQKDLDEMEADFQRRCAELRDKIRTRRWWQFWIPKTIPPWADRD